MHFGEGHALRERERRRIGDKLLHGAGVKPHADLVVLALGLDTRRISGGDWLATGRHRATRGTAALSAREDTEKADGRAVEGGAVLVVAHVDDPGPLAKRHASERRAVACVELALRLDAGPCRRHSNRGGSEDKGVAGKTACDHEPNTLVRASTAIRRRTGPLCGLRETSAPASVLPIPLTIAPSSWLDQGNSPG